MNDRQCCDGECKQGRDCPAQNVIEFQNRAGLHRFFSAGQSTSGSIWIDLLTFWCIKIPHINWGPFVGFALMAACGASVLYLAYAMVPFGLMFEHIAHAMGMAR